LAIKLDREKMRITLDKAYAIARSKQKLPSEWLHYVERIEECPSKTYIAALGAALLAKATDPRVDSMARTASAGPNGYAIRTVGEFMAAEAPRYGYHLGATGPWPLNNSPFYRNADRIDRFTRIRAGDKECYQDLVRYLQALNRLGAQGAVLALAAFLRRRIAYAKALQAQTAKVARLAAGSFPEVVEVATLFCVEDPEGGKRGQALVAALFDCAYSNVDLKGINNPRPLDVRVMRKGRIVLGAEVKQAVVGDDTGLHLAAEARKLDCDKALLVAIGEGQPPLDRQGLRQQALEDYGVLLEAVESVPELFAVVTTFSPVTASDLAQRFPRTYAKRLQEHDVSAAGRARWASLIEGLAAAPV